MKNILLLLTLFIGLRTANAQYVTIPDANFRAHLKSLYPSCFNASNQIDTTCWDVLTIRTIEVRNKNITSVEGLQYFKQLTTFGCFNNKITGLPQLPSTLTVLDCSYNLLTELPTLPLGLTTLYCYNNRLNSLPTLPNTIETLLTNSNNLTILPTLPTSLFSFDCRYNKLTSIPALPNTLRTIDCRYNRLVYLPPLNSLGALYCSNNFLVSLPSLSTNLGELDCSNNYLSSLPALPANLQELNCSNNNIVSLPSFPNNLKELYCNNTPISCLPLLPNSLINLNTKRSNITCLPNALNASAIADTVLPICTNATDICAVNLFVQGKIYNDINNNGVFNNGEQYISQQIIKVSPNNWLGVSDANGNYLVKLDTAINNTWSAINNYRYATITPSSYSLANIRNLGLQSGSYDFGIHFTSNVKDLETTLGSSPARPGFTTNVMVSTNNVGTVNQPNITIKLKKPNGFNVLSSSIAPTSAFNDTLIWNNISINYLAHQSINIELQVPINAVLGDSAVYEAWSNGTEGDTTPLDNYTKWSEIIRGSFDPNDKLVNKETLPPTYNAEKDRLLYTIRFQNTGTDTAFTVIVRDEIPTNLEVSSLRVVNASHPYQLIVREKNIVEVAFPNIQLPDSNANEPKSHGFVQLEFKPKAGLPVNAEINNNASIFFDYNSPVITNTATTRVQITTGIADNKKLAFKLFPNPSSEKITVELPYAGNGKWLLTDISGKIIKQSNIENNTISFDINVNDIESGTYLLSIESNDNLSSSKIVIFR